MPDEKLKLPIEMHKTAALRMPDEDVVAEEYLPRGWGNYMEDIAAAAQDVRRAIDNYGEVHRLVSRMDIPKEVKGLAARGMNTAKVTEDNWSGIQDDPFSMNMAWERAVEKGWKPRHIRTGASMATREAGRLSIHAEFVMDTHPDEHDLEMAGGPEKHEASALRFMAQDLGFKLKADAHGTVEVLGIRNARDVAKLYRNLEMNTPRDLGLVAGEYILQDWVLTDKAGAEFEGDQIGVWLKTNKTAASMTKHIRALRRMFPKASKIDTTESGGWNRGGIWTSFGEEGIADYYRAGYPNEFHPKLQKYMDKHGLFGEWRDAGTLMIYPA